MSRDPLRVVFMGTPKFAVPALRALVERGHVVAGVFTQPDRRAGRGRKLRASPVKIFSEERGLPVFQPRSLRQDTESARSNLAELAPDAVIVAAYGLFLPDEVLRLPRLGCLNIHPSLLPRHRGPSPVTTAILDGDEATGVTIMLLDEGMDTGPILAQQETRIAADETAEELTERLFELGANLLVDSLDRWEQGQIVPTPQNDEAASVTSRLEREDGRIDWSQSADSLARRVRAFTPWPGAFTTWRGRTLKVLSARSLDVSLDGTPGTVVRLDDSVIAVLTGSGALEVQNLQIEGRLAMSTADFVRGYGDFVGSILSA